MKRTLHETAHFWPAVLLNLAFLAAAAALQGAAITWQPATSITGDSDVLNTGIPVYAYAWSGISSTVNGASFTGSPGTNGGNNVLVPAFSKYGPAYFTSKAAPFSALSTAYSNILIGADYVSGLPLPVTLNNLTIGHNYTVQVWVNDPRGPENARSETITSTGGNTVTLKFSINSTNTNPGGPGQCTIGSFTADATNQTFTLNGAAGGVAQMNALQLRDVSLFSDANWMSMNPSIPGTDGPVSAAAADGSGNIYIGGSFTVVGGVIANSVAKWDGTNWSALGSGVNGGVSSLAVSGSDLYAGGSFTTAGGSAANYIAKWDGTNWWPLGSGMNGGVYSLAASSSNLYAVGGFTTAGGQAASNIAKWDGRAWSALPWMPDPPAGVVASGTNVYAGAHGGGLGAPVPGPEYVYIDKWDGNGWSELGSPFVAFSVELYAMAVSGNDLYAAGSFGIQRWDGNGWSDMGIGEVDVLAVSGSDLYAASAQNITKWNGSSWSALGSGMDYSVRALVVSGSNVFAGGLAIMPHNLWSSATNITKWDGSSWNALARSNSVMNGVVYAFGTSGNDLYVGGTFTTVGGVAANHIAKWDGSAWSALGSGIPGPGATANVYALAASGTKLYVGGDFRTTNGTPTYIAQWDGNSWSVLGSVGSGGDGVVYALTVSGSNLYAGGWFSTAGGVPVANIAKWDGNNWSALGSGLNGPFNGIVYALTMLGGDLYAAGNFTTAGGVSATNIAKWDGSSWSALGSGLGSETIGDGVYALAVSGGNLYAAGWFTTAGGVSATNIAKWNGSSWSAVGSGLNLNVYALAVSGGDLYASVSSELAALPLGWSPGYNLARWNGSTWSAAGSGLNNGVAALAVLGSDLYAGGSFTIAGGKVSAYIARAHLPSRPALSVLRSHQAVMLSWPSVDAAGFALEQADQLVPPIAWVPITAGITDAGTNKSVILPTTTGQRFFRLNGP